MAILDIDGARIAYDRHDEGAAGPGVVFIHAFPLNRMMWAPQVEELGGVFDVVAPDMRGQGASDLPDGPVSMERMADDVYTLVTKLEIAPATLVGVSMGGYVALAFARKYPEALRALVLADTRATADTPEAKAARYEMIRDVAANGPAAIAEEMLPKLLSKETVEAKSGLVVEVRRMIETTSPAGIAGALAGMAERRDATDVLSSIAVPTLVIVGSEDVVTPESDARALADAIPGARLEVIEGAAHLSSLERPDEFNELVREFLAALPSA